MNYRRCGICKRPPRANDPMGEMLVLPTDPHGDEPGVYHHVCSECLSLYDPAIPDIYSQPCVAVNEVGTFGSIINNHYCGICKRYAREGEMSEKHVRLAEADVDGTDIEPGGYMCCRECEQFWAPVILARHQRTGKAPAHMTTQAMPSGLLM